MMPPIPEEKLQAAIAHCVQSPRLAAFWMDAPDAARPYILLRFYAAAFTEDLTAEEYEARRAEAAASLSPDDIQFLLQNEKEMDEIKFLISLRNRKNAARPEPAPHHADDTNAARPPPAAVPDEKKAKIKIGSTRPSLAGATLREQRSFAPFLVLCALAAIGGAAWYYFFREAPQPEEEELSGPNQIRAFGGSPSTRDIQNPRSTDLPPQNATVASQGAADGGTENGGQLSVARREASERDKPTSDLPVTDVPATTSTDADADFRPAPGKTLQSLGGVKFGAPHPGERIGVELLSRGDSVASCGMGYAVNGPVLKKKFLSFGAQPVLWVTPKTFRVYKIEFAWQGGQKPEAAMNEVVSTLERRFEAKSQVGAESSRMIRTGDTTITVSDAGGAVKMCVEDARFKKEAKAEFDEVRRAMMEDFDASRLVAGGYPNGGMVPKKGKPAKDDSPKAFCGVAFGSLPTPGTHIVVVPETGVKTFFLDYQVRATSPFKGFTRGKAEFDASRGVYAVELHSVGAPVELTAAEHAANVRETLARRFPPAEGDGLPAVFHAGDVDISLAQDPQGGLVLRAENKAISPLKNRSHGNE